MRSSSCLSSSLDGTVSCGGSSAWVIPLERLVRRAVNPTPYERENFDAARRLQPGIWFAGSTPRGPRPRGGDRFCFPGGVLVVLLKPAGTLPFGGGVGVGVGVGPPPVHDRPPLAPHIRPPAE